MSPAKRGTKLRAPRREVGPKVFQDVRPFSRHLAEKVEERRAREWRKVSVGMLLMALLAGAVIAHSAPRLYLASQTYITLFAPSRLVAGAENEVYVFLHSGTGEDREGAPVAISLLTGGAPVKLAEAKTDASGAVAVRFALPRVGESKGVLRVQVGATTYDAPVAIDSVMKVHLTTDKPIYQPGQTVHVRSLAFLSGAGYYGDVTLTVADPDGNRIFRETLRANAYGVSSYDYPLADILPLGAYKLTAKVLERETESTFLVQRYVLPKAVIDIDTTRDWYAPDQHIAGTLWANYSFGKPVAGKVEMKSALYTGSFTEWKTVEGTLVDGRFPFSIQSPWIPSYGAASAYLFLNASVTDTAGHAEEKNRAVPISTRSILTTVIADTNVVGADSEYLVVARFPDGSPAAGAEVRHDGGVSTTDERGVATMRFPYTGQPSLGFIVMTEGESPYYDTRTVPLGKGALKVLGPKAEFAVGEGASFAVAADGLPPETEVYYQAVSAGSVIASGKGRLDSIGGVRLAITPKMAPLAEMRVSAIKEGRVVADSFAFKVLDERLNVGVSTPNATYFPRDRVPVVFRLSEPGGVGVPGVLGVSIVDSSVFEIDERFRAQMLPDPEAEAAGSTGTDAVAFAMGVSAAPPASSVQLVSEQEAMGGIVVDNSAQVAAEAEEVGAQASGTFWGFAILAGFLAFAVAMAALAARKEHRLIAAIAFLAVMVMLATILTASSSFMAGIAIFLVVLGIFVLITVALTRKNKAGAVVGAIFAVLIMLASTVGLAALLYVSTSGFLTSSSSPTGRAGDTGCSACGQNATGGSGAPPPMGGIPALRPSAGSESGLGFPTIGQRPGSPPVPGFTDSPDRMRLYFPETWHWEPALITDPEGKATLELEAPDTITTWKVSALASTKDARVATGEADVKVFKKMFVEPDVPVSVVLGDVFELKALIYNYDSERHNVSVTLQNESWFTLLSPPTQVKNASMNEATSVSFRIRVEEVGWFTVTMRADAGGYLKDTVKRPISSVAVGQKISETRTGSLGAQDSKTEVVDVRPEMVENSSLAFVKLFSGSDPVIYDGAKGFIRMVTGCGEQSTSLLTVDILAYRNAYQNMTDKERKQFQDTINAGIQYEMGFMTSTPGGRAMTWHRPPEPADLWLTAWAIQAFKDLNDAGFDIDDRIIGDMAAYLRASASADGNYIFPEIGHWSINSDLKSERTAATAYVVRALAYAGIDVLAQVPNSVSYLRAHLGAGDETYTIALGLDAILVAGLKDDPLVPVLVGELEKRAVRDGSVLHWKWSDDGGGGYWRSDNTVETTGYAVMAFTRFGRPTTAQAGARYLVKSMNGFGGWGSTHNTAIALQSLNLAKLVSTASYDFEVSANGLLLGRVHIDDSNNDLTFIYDLSGFIVPGGRLDLALNGSGEGELFYTLHYEYFVPWTSPPPSTLVFDVSYPTTSAKVGETVCGAATLGHSGRGILRMAAIEITAPVGFAFDEEKLGAQKASQAIGDYEFTATWIRVYVDNVPASGATVKFCLRATEPASSTQPGALAFDTYAAGVEARTKPLPWTSTR